MLPSMPTWRSGCRAIGSWICGFPAGRWSRRRAAGKGGAPRGGSTMGKREHIIVGLDVGTTKICAIVGEVSGVEAGGRPQVKIIGIGTHPSRGLRKGVVVNVESTIESIKKAVEEAELMAGVEINSVYTGIAGSHIKGFNSRGVIAIKNREVTAADIKRVQEAAKAVASPMDREILHVLPRGY